MKHTTGEWIVDKNEQGLPIVWAKDTEINGALHVVAHIRNGKSYEYEEIMANAHLIAASPKLLDAAKRVYTMIVNGSADPFILQKPLVQLGRAIQEAEGR